MPAKEMTAAPVTPDVTPPLDLVGKTQRVHELHDGVEAGMRKTADGAIECGKLLTEIKEEVGHGQWEKWAEANLRFTVQHARRYMRIARLAAAGQIEHGCSKSPWALLADLTAAEKEADAPQGHGVAGAEQRADEDVEHDGEERGEGGAGRRDDDGVLSAFVAFLSSRIDKIAQCECARILERSGSRWPRQLAKALRAEPPRASRPRSLIEHLADHGGLRPDDGGELCAIFGKNHFVPGRGSVVRPDGMSLDRAREVAEQGQYLPTGSDINALLNAISDELAGRVRFADRDISQAMDWREQQREGIETLLAEQYFARGPDGELTATKKFRDAKVRVKGAAP